MSKARKQLYTATASKTEQMSHKVTGLPELPGRHGDNLESVVFGPRREMTVRIKPLLWAGNQGFYGPAIVVRFGGIVNYK